MILEEAFSPRGVGNATGVLFSGHIPSVRPGWSRVGVRPGQDQVRARARVRVRVRVRVGGRVSGNVYVRTSIPAGSAF